MPTPEITTVGSNLAEPINHSVTAANSGQFALMLSFVFEAQAAAAVGAKMDVVAETESVTTQHGIQREFRLELGLEQALLSNNQAQLNLMRSLLMERTQQLLAQWVPQVDHYDERPLSKPQRRNEDLIAEIQKARKLGLRNPAVEQQARAAHPGMAVL